MDLKARNIGHTSGIRPGWDTTVKCRPLHAIIYTKEHGIDQGKATFYFKMIVIQQFYNAIILTHCTHSQVSIIKIVTLTRTEMLITLLCRWNIEPQGVCQRSFICTEPCWINFLDYDSHAVIHMLTNFNSWEVPNFLQFIFIPIIFHSFYFAMLTCSS